MTKSLEPSRTVEQETKLQLSSGEARALSTAGRLVKSVDQLNIYYDWEWRLANEGATFRVRLESRGAPIITLKLPLRSKVEGPRRMRELELVETQLTLWPSGKRFLNVSEDLLPAFAEPLLRMGMTTLARVGWMRNKRDRLIFDGVGTLELDTVRLPKGVLYHEAEIESPDRVLHTRLTSLVQNLAPHAKPATMSKFALFRLHASQSDWIPWVASRSGDEKA